MGIPWLPRLTGERLVTIEFSSTLSWIATEFMIFLKAHVETILYWDLLLNLLCLPDVDVLWRRIGRTLQRRFLSCRSQNQRRFLNFLAGNLVQFQTILLLNSAHIDRCQIVRELTTHLFLLRFVQTVWRGYFVLSTLLWYLLYQMGLFWFYR